jgi:hypothetical protein
MVNGVFTPKSLNWFVLTADDAENVVNFQFENKRGLTFMFIKHTCTEFWTLRIPTTKTIVDNPFDLSLSEGGAFIHSLANKKQNIIGPFSGSFDNNGIVSGDLSHDGMMIPGTKLFVAVVSIPQGNM